jgi:uncharacterized protein (TIGR02147 family)
MIHPEPDPSEFIDYRDYLAQLFAVRKGNCSWYSYKSFGDKAGMDASLFAKVISKSRHIAKDSIRHFAKACDLNAPQSEYFTAMVHFTKAKTDAEAKIWFDKMLFLRAPQARRVEGEAYLFYQKWYHTAIRAALDYFAFNGNDPEQLANHLRPCIDPEQVKESISLLSQLQLIQKDKEGYWRPTELGVTSGKGWKSVAVHTFQCETLHLALSGLVNIPKSLRNYSTITMNISKEDFEELKERIREFRQQVVKYIHSRDAGDSVYQLNIQLLPLTYPVGHKVKAPKVKSKQVQSKKQENKNV